jgi:hypothetical protein
MPRELGHQFYKYSRNREINSTDQRSCIGFCGAVPCLIRTSCYRYYSDAQEMINVGDFKAERGCDKFTPILPSMTEEA